MNHTYHQTPTQTSKPLHISPVSVNSPPHLNGSDQSLLEELTFQFASQANAGKEQVWHAGQKYYAGKIGRNPRTIRRSVRKLRQAGGLGLISCHQPKGRDENGYWKTNVIRPGALLGPLIQDKRYALLGREKEKAARRKRRGQAFHGRTLVSSIASKKRQKQKKKQKKLKVEGSNQIQPPLFEPKTDQSKEVMAEIKAFQARLFPKKPHGP